MASVLGLGKQNSCLPWHGNISMKDYDYPSRGCCIMSGIGIPVHGPTGIYTARISLIGVPRTRSRRKRTDGTRCDLLSTSTIRKKAVFHGVRTSIGSSSSQEVSENAYHRADHYINIMSWWCSRNQSTSSIYGQVFLVCPIPLDVKYTSTQRHIFVTSSLDVGLIICELLWSFMSRNRRSCRQLARLSFQETTRNTYFHSTCNATWVRNHPQGSWPVEFSPP